MTLMVRLKIWLATGLCTKDGTPEGETKPVAAATIPPVVPLMLARRPMWLLPGGLCIEEDGRLGSAPPAAVPVAVLLAVSLLPCKLIFVRRLLPGFRSGDGTDGTEPVPVPLVLTECRLGSSLLIML